MRVCENTGLLRDYRGEFINFLNCEVELIAITTDGLKGCEGTWGG